MFDYKKYQEKREARMKQEDLAEQNLHQCQPLPAMCDAVTRLPYSKNNLRCEAVFGHTGEHRNGDIVWSRQLTVFANASQPFSTAILPDGSIAVANPEVPPFIIRDGEKIDIKPFPPPGGVTQRAEAVRHDQGKTDWSLLPIKAIELVLQVLMFGAKKYGRDNWKSGFHYRRCYNSCQRHLAAWIELEDNDKESGLPHLAHAVCSLLFLITYQYFGTGVDDR